MRLIGFLLFAFSGAQAATVSGAGGVDIHYERYGSATDTIVFVHGWTCDSSYWHEQIDEFAADYTVIAIDLGGHGKSGSNRDDWSMAAFGEDVATVVRAENAIGVTLVGHSMGGAVVIEAAQRLKDRVSLVIAVDTLQEPTGQPYSDEQSRELWAPFSNDFETSVEAFVRRSFFLPSAPPDIVDWVARDMASANAETALAAGHALTTWNVPEGITAIGDIPFVLINADYRPTDADGLRDVHTESRLVLMQGVGHFPMLVRPDDFNSALKEVLATTLP